MKSMRFWGAIGWGVVSFTVTVCALWSFTLMDIFEVIFFAVMAYIAVIGGILWLTEPKKRPATKKLNPADVPIITLKKEEWK